MFGFIPIQYQLAAKILVILAVLIVGYSAGWSQRGTKADNELLTIQNQQQAVIVQYQKEVAQTKQTLQGFANKVEEQNNANKKKRESELDKYRNLVKQHGGLYDNNTVPPTRNDTTAGDSSSTTTGTGRTRLSEELSRFLLDQANKADQVVDQDKLCLGYIKKLTEIQKQQKERTNE